MFDRQEPEGGSRRPHHLFSASERAAAGSNRGAQPALPTAPYCGV